MGKRKAEVARMLGISRQALDNLIRAGKVKGVLSDGSMDENVAVATYNTNVRSYNNERKNDPEKTSGDIPSGMVNVSRAVKEKYEALQTKAEYERFIGELVESKMVEQVLSTRASEIRDRLLTIADRLAPVLINVGDANLIHQKIYTEISEALTRLGEPIEAKVVDEDES